MQSRISDHDLERLYKVLRKNLAGRGRVSLGVDVAYKLVSELLKFREEAFRKAVCDMVDGLLENEPTARAVSRWANRRRGNRR